jgi:hypothetical protein
MRLGFVSLDGPRKGARNRSMVCMLVKERAMNELCKRLCIHSRGSRALVEDASHARSGQQSFCDVLNKSFLHPNEK